MDEYVVKLTRQAQRQMREIAHYVAFSLQARNTALRLIDTIAEEIESLSRFPNRVALTDDEPWHSLGIHKLPVKNYLVYFWIDEPVKKVQVTAIVYGRRDQKQALSEMPLE